MKLKLASLSAIACSSLFGVTLYMDPVTKQVFAEDGKNRVKIESSKDDFKHITILDKNSPDFFLGKQTHINMKIVAEDDKEKWIKAGVRIQGTLESKTTDYNDPTKKDVTINDAYLRRVRFEIQAGFNKYTSFTMDVRNDKANYGIENPERNFNVGDAYVKIKKPFKTSLLNFKLYRAKIDISRTETVKSARVIYYDRPYIADAAAQYISFNRRGANIQAYGDWKKKIHYQIAVGSAASPDKFVDAFGSKASSYSVDMDDQSFFYGGKVVLSPFDGWEERKKTETYFGKGKHFSVGISYWAIPKLKGSVSSSTFTSNFDLNRKLINAEISGHYKGLFVQGEYFKFYDYVKQWDVNGSVETGTSSGWYVTGEYVFTNLNYIAPFARYESWDTLNGSEGHNLTSVVAGINWYLMGNTIKAGISYQQDKYDQNIGDKTVSYYRLTSQFFF